MLPAVHSSSGAVYGFLTAVRPPPELPELPPAVLPADPLDDPPDPDDVVELDPPFAPPDDPPLVYPRPLMTRP